MSHLTVEQRYEIQTLNKLGTSQKDIALYLGRDKSVISRELRRNCDLRSGVYRAELAQRKYEQRQAQKPRFLRFIEPVQAYVEEHLAMDYSPEQITGRAKVDQVECVSHERIYQFIWEDKKKGGELHQHLRTQGRRYRKRGSSKDSRGMLVGRVGIEHRPPEVGLKERLGDLEVDLVIGAGHQGALVTINDRASGLVKIRKVASKEAAVVQQAIVEALEEWKPWLHTITSDNGKEFAYHQLVSSELMIDYYFATPYHSWERGANENLNGLIRQYFPKKMSFTQLTQQEVAQVEEKLNMRPRKRLGFQSPFEQYQKLTKTPVAFVT